MYYIWLNRPSLEEILSIENLMFFPFFLHSSLMYLSKNDILYFLYYTDIRNIFAWICTLNLVKQAVNCRQHHCAMKLFMSLVYCRHKYKWTLNKYDGRANCTLCILYLWTESYHLIFKRIKAHENRQLYYSTSFKIRIFDI